MQTQEERLSALEKARVKADEAVGDLNHHVTMLIGIVQRQEWDIREMKGSLRTIDGRLISLENRLNSLEQRVTTSFEAQDKKLDHMVRLLTTLTGQEPDQEK